MARQSSREPCSMKRSGMPMWCTARCDAVCREALGHRAARAAGDGVLLERDDAVVAAPRAGSTSVLVERLHEAHVHQRRVESLGDRRRTARPSCRTRAAAGRCGPRAALRPGRPAARVISVSMAHARAVAARIAHGGRAIERHGGVEHLPALVLVGRRHHHHVRDAAQVGEVERALVRRAVAAHEAAAVDRERHRQVLQRDVVDQLVVGALQERRVDRHHRARALAGHAGGERHRVLLGDRHVEVAIREAASRTRRGPSPRASRA